MERSDPASAARRCRRAYERARLRRATVQAFPFGLALAVAAANGGSWRAAVVAGMVVAALVAGGWYGRGIARGMRIGAVAGLVPLLCPMLVSALGHHCAGCAPAAPMPLCILVCTLSGAAAVIWTASRPGFSLRSIELASATGIAAGMGVVGCVVAGGFGLLGLATGIVVAGVPTAIVRAVR